MAMKAQRHNVAKMPSRQGVSTRFPTSKEMKYVMGAATSAGAKANAKNTVYVPQNIMQSIFA
jgi:hypothetical protein